MNIKEGVLELVVVAYSCARTYACARSGVVIFASWIDGILLLLMEGRGLLRACFRGPVLQDLSHCCTRTQKRGGGREEFSSQAVRARSSHTQGQEQVWRNTGLFNVSMKEKDLYGTHVYLLISAVIFKC